MGYIKSESGAVTVDWVVLTASLVGLGLAVGAVVSAGVQDLSTDTKNVMERENIVRVAFSALGNTPYLTQSMQDELAGIMETATSAELSTDYATYAAASTNYEEWRAGITAGNYLQDGTDYRDPDTGEIVFTHSDLNTEGRNFDYASVYADEAAQRGLAWNPDTSTFE